MAKFDCDECKKKVRGKRNFYIESFPNVLIINLKRFDAKNKMIMTKCQYPEQLDMSEFLNPKTPAEDEVQSELPYRLIGVICHQKSQAAKYEDDEEIELANGEYSAYALKLGKYNEAEECKDDVEDEVKSAVEENTKVQRAEVTKKAAKVPKQKTEVFDKP